MTTAESLAAQRLLLVEQRAEQTDAVKAAVDLIVARSGLDAYVVRQRLIGYGPALLATDQQTRLEPLLDLLREAGYQAGIVDSQRPTVAPQRLKSLSLDERRVTLHTDSDSLTVGPRQQAHMVLGDLSGAVANRLLRLGLTQNGAVKRIETAEFYRTALAAQPTADLYILPIDTPFDVVADNLTIVRLVPGGFNPQGLEELMTHSAAQNIDRILRAVKKRAGRSSLDVWFGLADIPGCKPITRDAPGAVAENLKRLHRYGWFSLLLTAASSQRVPAFDDDEDASGRSALAAVSARGAAPAAGAGVMIAGAAAAAAELDDPDRDDSRGDTSSDGGESSLFGAPGSAHASHGELPPPPPITNALTPRPYQVLVGIAAGLFFALAGGGFSLLAGTPAGEALLTWAMVWGVQRGVFLFMATPLALWGWFHFLRIKRFIDNTPTSKVRSLAMGAVELAGVARRAYNLLSPLSLTPCVWFEMKKYRRTRDHNGNRQWRLVSSINSGVVPFYLEDETGRVLVDPQGGAIKAGHRNEAGGGSNVMLMGASFRVGPNEKYMESLIPESARLYILGAALPQRDDRPSLARRVAEKLKLLKQDTSRLMAYDANGDGRIDEEEWKRARQDMESLALKESLQDRSTARRQEEHAVIAKPRHGGLPFIIAEGAEKSVSTRFGLYSAASLAAALIFLTAGILLATGVIMFR